MKALLVVPAFVLIACSQSPTMSSAATARSGADSIMLRVTNTSDSAVQIGGFPDLKYPEPQPSGGIISLGWAPPGTSCLALPDSIVIHLSDAATGQPLDNTWRAASDGISVTASGLSVTKHFVPGTAGGWNITVPGNNTTPVAADRCR